MATVDELDGPRFFSLARRVFAYDGVMAARYRHLEDENQTHQPTPRVPQQQRTSGADVIPLDQFKAQFPGIVD
jgi:hypothetical protein